MAVPNLNRALVLEAPDRAEDGSGGYVETWGVLGTLWAEVKSRTGREQNLSGVTVSLVSYRITVRAAPVGSEQRPVAGQRFRDGDRIYAIRAVTEKDSDHRYLECFADEEVAT